MPELNNSYHAPFTDRERDVLALIAEGRSAKEIALYLGIAPRTVEKHADHVRLKMRAKNRTHMVSIAILTGLLHPGAMGGVLSGEHQFSAHETA